MSTTWGGPLCVRPEINESITVDLGDGQIITDTFKRVRGVVRKAEQVRLMKFRKERRVLLEKDKDGQLNRKTGKWGLKPKRKAKPKAESRNGVPEGPPEKPSRSRYYVRTVKPRARKLQDHRSGARPKAVPSSPLRSPFEAARPLASLEAEPSSTIRTGPSA
jgi:hypothetical protein